MKHIDLLGHKLYAFCAMDTFSRKSLIHISSTSSSLNTQKVGVTQFWARPHHPKDKPFLEQIIGTLQREWLDYHYELLNMGELSSVVNNWLETYHFYSFKNQCPIGVAYEQY